MAEILDNQEVTTDTLNNIAIDLGATSFNGFTTNKFGADALNDITKALTGKGITQGGNKCNPYISGTDVYINTGTIIFATGAKIRITTPQKIEKQSGTYIYALNDTSRNIAEIVVAETKPTTGDCVMLAYVDSTGAIQDMREWSVSNVLLANTAAVTKNVTFSVPSSSASAVYKEFDIDVGWDGWSRIIYPYYISSHEADNAIIIDENSETTLPNVKCGTYGSPTLKVAYSDLTILRQGSNVHITGYIQESITFNCDFTFI